MRVKRIDHVGVAVRDKAAAENFMFEILGARKRVDATWEYKGQEFNWAYYDVGDEGRIELLSSADPENFINKFIDKYGEGLHHITVVVEDLREALGFLSEKGIEVLDVNTENQHWKEAFISPRDSFGMLIQIAECDDEYWGLDS